MAKTVLSPEFRKEFWQPKQLSPIPMLTALRDLVLERSEKRMPKWRFQLTKDMAVEIQPKPRLKALFDCRARGTIDQSPIPRDIFTDKCDWQNVWDMKFCLNDDWTFKPGPTSVYRSTEVSLYIRQQRILLELPEVLGRFRPSALLHPNCLICGKALTDPASMARFVGPECWGSASLKMPFIYDIPDAIAA